MRKIYFFLIAVAVILTAVIINNDSKNQNSGKIINAVKTEQQTLNLLSITAMREKSYPGSDIKIEEALADGVNYHQYIASYLSDGLKIYGFLTVPKVDPSASPQDDNRKYPVIVFNHGYIPPEQYRTTERYVGYVDAFASIGYVVFKPDYRGNGSSEGQPEGSYYSPAYTVDVLNALASIKKFPEVDPKRIGMWGHSMGGNIALRSLVISSDIKAAVIWGGVVGTYNDLMNNWQRRIPYQPSPRELSLRNRSRTNLVSKYGTPASNPDFWHSIDPNFNLQYLQTPVQLHAGLADEQVPWQFSEGLKNRLENAGKYVEYYTYPGADHNISEPSFDLAMQRSVEFFAKYLK